MKTSSVSVPASRPLHISSPRESKSRLRKRRNDKTDSVLSVEFIFLSPVA
ncbi:MAG: hypothetical protein IM638_06200 [Bacteroidetes bacterium]|nr:hypothetical protein [Bacteroidota bacterium]